MTNSQQSEALPITFYLNWILSDRKEQYEEYGNLFHIDAEISTLSRIIPQVRTLETEKLAESSLSIAKAKQEERERMVGILEEMLITRGLDDDYVRGKSYAIKEAIERISNNP